MLIYCNFVGCDMEWQQVISFYQVAKLKSFTRAARSHFENAICINTTDQGPRKGV